MKKQFKLCDGDCNNCLLLQEENARVITRILNEILLRTEDEKITEIVNSICPNLTCCFDCHIDDFCHVTGCKIMKDLEKDLKKEKQHAKKRLDKVG